MQTPHDYKLCPNCGAEYRRDAERCAECNVALVHQSEISAEQDELAAFPPASELACVRVAPIAWIRALSEALQERGVTHRVEPVRAEDAPADQRVRIFGNTALFGLYLREDALADARALDESIAAQLLPDEAPTVDSGESEACPACGAALGADATECPDCGLAFG